jgi:glutamate racemase
VICTQATATSRSYDDAFAAAPQIKLTTSACPKFVDFVEAGITGGSELLAVAEEYLAPIQEAQVDTLILGCTHYPLLTGVISYVLGDDVSLVSSAEECGKSTFSTLTRRDLLQPLPRDGYRRFLTTGNPEKFTGIGRRLMGDFVADVEPLPELLADDLGVVGRPG